MTQITFASPPHRLSDVIPAHSPYAFGYEPQVTGIKEEGFDLSLLEDWWQEIKRRATEQSTRWSEEEREAWQSFEALPIPKKQAEWEAMGFDRAPYFWFYGLGLTPMLVIEVPAIERLHAWINQHLSHNKLGFVEIRHSQGTYWRKAMKRWTILARTHQSRVYLTFIPQVAEPVLLSLFLKNHQEHNLTPQLINALKRLPTEARGSGIIQLQALTDLFFGSSIPLLKYGGQAFGLPSAVFEPCDKDLRAISATIPVLTFGLAQKTSKSSVKGNHKYDIYTHFEISDPLLTQLHELQHQVEPIWIPKRSGSLGLGIRFELQALARILQERGDSWNQNPWRCRFLRSLNGLTQLTSRPDYSVMINLIGALSGASIQLELDHVENIKNKTANQTSIFTGWIEIIHHNAPLLLSFIYTALTQKTMPPSYLEPNRTVHDISKLFPILPNPRLSLHPQRMIMSIGERGEEAHQQMIQHLITPVQVSDSSSMSRPPLLWLDIPSILSAWFSHKLQKTSQIKSNAQDQTYEPRLERLQIHLDHSGLMIQSSLSTKSL